LLVNGDEYANVDEYANLLPMFYDVSPSFTDDIIKQNRKKKTVPRRGFQQFRGRVGGKLVKGRNTANTGVSRSS